MPHKKRPKDCRDKEEKKNEALTLSVTVINVILFQFMALELLKAEPSSYGSKTQQKHSMKANGSYGKLKPEDLRVRE